MKIGDTLYLTVDNVLELHRVLIQRYGGIDGIRSPAAIEVAVFRPQSGYYPDIFGEAAALLESLANNHPFLDGNKRIAFAVMDVFFAYQWLLPSCQCHGNLWFYVALV